MALTTVPLFTPHDIFAYYGRKLIQESWPTPDVPTVPRAIPRFPGPPVGPHWQGGYPASDDSFAAALERFISINCDITAQFAPCAGTHTVGILGAGRSSNG